MNNLAKVRAELERRIKSYHRCMGEGLDIYTELLSFIDSLTGEKEEELLKCPVCCGADIDSSFDRDVYNPGYDYTCSCGYSWANKGCQEIRPPSTPEQWKPTPGELIEVDSVKSWITVKFKRMENGWFFCSGDDGEAYWRTARPIEKVEPIKFVESNIPMEPIHGIEISEGKVYYVHDGKRELIPGVVPTAEKVDTVPVFDWEEICDKAVFAHREEIDQNTEMIGAIGYQLELITKYLLKK